MFSFRSDTKQGTLSHYSEYSIQSEATWLVSEKARMRTFKAPYRPSYV